MRDQCTPGQLALPLAPERWCAAPGCGRALVRRSDERPARFRERKTCSRTCRYRLSAASRRALCANRPKWCGRCRRFKDRSEFGPTATYCRPCFAAYVRGRYTPRPRIKHVAPEGFKQCCRCREEKPLVDFNLHRSQPDGRQRQCQACQRTWGLASYHKNEETRRAYYARHREALIAKAVAWQRANSERRREVNRRYHQRHSFQIRQRDQRRKARVKGAWTGPVDYAAILARDGHVCHICGGTVDPADLHFDHVVPIARGGKHHAHNIRPAHARCNLAKGARVIDSGRSPALD